MMMFMFMSCHVIAMSFPGSGCYMEAKSFYNFRHIISATREAMEAKRRMQDPDGPDKDSKRSRIQY